jgi:hypothetical protein
MRYFNFSAYPKLNGLSFHIAKFMLQSTYMPEISRFSGIIITMYPEAGERHNTPHFHARYGEYRATFSIATGDLLGGSLPKAQLRLVQAWAELRRPQLEADWDLLTRGRTPNKIPPLS